MKQGRAKTVILIISGVLTIAICAVMNFHLIPLIESGTKGIRMFDMNTFGYSFEQAKSFVASLSAQSRDAFLYKQLPLDFVYPVAYTLFFSLILSKLNVKHKALLVLPILLMIFDYLENVLSIVMLTSDFSKTVSAFAGTFTVIKSILMYVLIVLILTLLAIRLYKTKKDLN